MESREITSRALDNPRLRRYQRIAQFIIGGIVFWGGYYGPFQGQIRFHLIREGIRTQGKIIDYKYECTPWTHRNRIRAGLCGYHPIVEFTAGGRTIHFKHRLGSTTRGIVNAPVPVLYNASNPNTAMIDHPLGNWMLWGPISIVGLFLLAVGLKGLITND